MTTIFDEETEEQSADRFENETAEVDGATLEPEGEVIAPAEQATAEDSFPLESLITPQLCGLIFSVPYSMRAKQTEHEWWRLDEEEKLLVGTATQPLIVYLVRRWLGDGVGMYAAAVAALAAVTVPRQIREQQERAAAKRGERQGGPSVSKPNGAVPPSRAESPRSSESAAAANPASSGEWGVPFRE